MKFNYKKLMTSGNGILILGVVWLLFWLGPAFSLFEEDSRWGHNFAIPIIFINVGLAYNVPKISCQLTAAVASFLTIPILIDFLPWDLSTIIACIFLGIFFLLYVIEKNRKTELINPNKRLRAWLKMHLMTFAYFGLVHMTIIFFLVRWNNWDAFGRYLPEEQEDIDTIIFNAMLVILTLFAIMERFVKKIGRFNMPKTGFVWSILMVIVPLIAIGLSGD
ncbi:MAG: hypothetical protein JSW28_09540 [Thermoplasmata archaeon]|nr:MAG: hypothetical protein JSW28_09540 [Thermoplasmata archaeon]